METIGQPGPLLEGRFEGRADFIQLVRDALGVAAQAGWRELILSDASFYDWPLGERAVIDSLNAWARGGRQLTLLAKNYDEVVRAILVSSRGVLPGATSSSAVPVRTRTPWMYRA
jgi:hypothetical protein